MSNISVITEAARRISTLGCYKPMLEGLSAAYDPDATYREKGGKKILHFSVQKVKTRCYVSGFVSG